MARDYTIETEKIKKQIVENGLITKEQLDNAIEVQRKTNDSLIDIIVSLDYADREKIMNFISELIDVPYVKLDIKLIDPEIVGSVSKKLALKHKLIPVLKLANTLTVAMTDPFNLYALQDLKFAAEIDIEPLFCSEEDIMQAITFFYIENKEDTDDSNPTVTPIVEPRSVSKAGSLQSFNLEKTDGISVSEAATDFATKLSESPANLMDEKAREEERQSPVIKITNTIIRQAITQNVSDIHFEPFRENLRVRFRIDGVLKIAHVLPLELSKLVISRLKVMSRLNITEKRLPQDGVFLFRYAGSEIDCRLATSPTVYGESAIIRLLHQSKKFVSVDELGFTADMSRQFKNVIKYPSGFILVTGPTGSGKTTTLYAALNEINSEANKIITAEDPVEYRIAGVNQIQMHHQIGLDFSKALRSMLRQDPDIILVGEIRDRETAQIAVQAVLTGHLLFSTLHTTNSVNSIIRLMDLGVEYFYIREVLSLIVAQRLVRKLCPHCREEYKPLDVELDDSLLRKLAINKETLFRATGCKKCDNTGYVGRIPVFEMLSIDTNISSHITPDTNSKMLWNAARDSGVKTLWENAVYLVEKGITTIDEISAKVPRPPFKIV